MRVLVTAASKHGATMEIASWIGEELGQAGVQATVSELEAAPPVDGFDAVVLGSAVYAGHWLEPARRFAKDHAAELATRPTWLFSSGPIGEPPKPTEGPVDAPKIAAQIGARGERVFAGRIDRSLVGFGERAVLTAMRVPDRDDRSRSEVTAWAASIAAELTG